LHGLTGDRLFAALAASALFSLAMVALAFGVAGLASDNAHLWMRSWEGQGRIDDVRQWEQAHSRLQLARRLNPLKADYDATMGHLMAWRALGRQPGSAGSVDARTSAERYYLAAVRGRPGWGYAWVNLAENRLLQGKLDAEYVHALEMAIFFAPWEPWVQKKVAWLGMATWDELPDRSRELVRDSIRRMVVLGEFPNEVVRLAVQYDWLEQLRPMLQTERQRSALDFVFKQLESR